MASSDDFEQSVVKFTLSRTGEKVCIDLLADKLVFRPLCQQYSTSLGDFWAHVLQHPNNYPVYSHTYKKLYRMGNKYELQLRVDGVTLRVDLASGCLTIKGSHVIDWAVSRFPEIMNGYLKPPVTASKELREQYTKQEVDSLHQEQKKYYKKYIEDWPDETLEASANVLDAGKTQQYYEAIDPDGFLKGSDLETHNPIADLLNEEETKQQLKRLLSGSVIQGSVMYRLWKSTLNLWFADKDAKVFIVTPHIDSVRLTDICRLFLNNKLTASLEMMCVPVRNAHGRFADVQRETMKKFSPQDQVLLEYKVFSSVVYPLMDIMTSFIAMTTDNKAKILLTNVHFDKACFQTANSATVLFEKIDRERFMKEFCGNFI
ncbi:unnamed protein product [Candidula unifasciata]|uniref:Uncharacterized protein n=1 Tax=Candidula unifasciata TaxID=100452 RepID=A0A8S3YK49_9EUPU|nr:unnamed protein product [Candidula unifasciata]